MKKEIKPVEGTEDLGDKNSHAYKCKMCGQLVNFHFILKFIKDSGLCPDCFHK